MTAKVFSKLLGLFVLLLVFQTVVMVVVFRLVEHARGITLGGLSREALWSGLIALVLALPVAAAVAGHISGRLRRVEAFARRIAGGDLSTRLEAKDGNDEFAAMEAALNRTAERLDGDFAEMESRRQELAAMLDAMQEAVVAITADGVVRWSNAVMQRIAGTQIHPGRPLIHSVRDPELLNCVQRTLKHREICIGRATVLAPGHVLEVNAAPLPSGGALVVLHDVSDIEAAQKSRRDFVANVSHELRTPLTSIQGYVETLMEDEMVRPETTREFLQIILKNARRMNRLTEDLLALASVESPDYKLSLRPVRAGALVKDAMQALGGMVMDSGVKLQLAGAPNETVMVDPDAMNQVFGNLVENALKYAKEGRRIRVGARAVEGEVEFTVQDFGPGIASEHLERIFERFYRVDKGRSRESGGTGLGLAIVKHIVQAHGGRIWAESELGSGVAFHFTLPVVRAALQEPAPAPDPASESV